jgi:four helix bundle protein
LIWVSRVGQNFSWGSRPSPVASWRTAEIQITVPSFDTPPLSVAHILQSMGNYQELTVWKHAHGLALDLYRSTQHFPDGKRYGITSQLRRAAISVPSNIAEGTGRVGNRDQARFLQIARGSVCELECQLLLARDIGYLTLETWSALDKRCREVGKMLNGLIGSLGRRQNHTSSEL